MSILLIPIKRRIGIVLYEQDKEMFFISLLIFGFFQTDKQLYL
jgi:hypothetical protein